jgi:hypothetical protein
MEVQTFDARRQAVADRNYNQLPLQALGFEVSSVTETGG